MVLAVPVELGNAPRELVELRYDKLAPERPRDEHDVVVDGPADEAMQMSPVNYRVSEQ